MSVSVDPSVKNVLSVPEGKILDFLTNTFVNDTPEEYVRQNIEKALVRQYTYPAKVINEADVHDREYQALYTGSPVLDALVRLTGMPLDRMHYLPKELSPLTSSGRYSLISSLSFSMNSVIFIMSSVPPHSPNLVVILSDP